MTNQGGDAFPKRIRSLNPAYDGKDANQPKYIPADVPGMSVRTFIAAKCLAARLANPKSVGSDQEKAARAVRCADHLIKELEL